MGTFVSYDDACTKLSFAVEPKLLVNIERGNSNRAVIIGMKCEGVVRDPA